MDVPTSKQTEDIVVWAVDTEFQPFNTSFWSGLLATQRENLGQLG